MLTLLFLHYLPRSMSEYVFKRKKISFLHIPFFLNILKLFLKEKIILFIQSKHSKNLSIFYSFSLFIHEDGERHYSLSFLITSYYFWGDINQKVFCKFRPLSFWDLALKNANRHYSSIFLITSRRIFFGLTLESV